MNTALQNLMREATRLTRSGNLQEATQMIQNALRNTPQTPAQTPKNNGQTPAATLPITPLPTSSSSRPLKGEFVQGSHTAGTLTRRYKLYTPPSSHGKSLPLVVMLHGCTQNPDDFSIGTGMNKLANDQGFYVLYPEQSANANLHRCWNWFKQSDQARGKGEAGLLASMTLAVMQQCDIDTRRVYVAGLSAGGAMAAIMAAAYPEIFAAVGVHSGLAVGAAGNVSEALVAMKSGARDVQLPLSVTAVPTIVFHGDKDQTVHPRNAEQIIAALRVDEIECPEQGRSKQGRVFTRTCYLREGVNFAEMWMLHGGGHAWSGGNPGGTFTDSVGPNASAEMLRFFAEHSQR